MPARAGAAAARSTSLGALTVTAGLGAAVFGIVRAPEDGWALGADPGSSSPAAVALLGAFVVDPGPPRASR